MNDIIENFVNSLLNEPSSQTANISLIDMNEIRESLLAAVSTSINNMILNELNASDREKLEHALGSGVSDPELENVIGNKIPDLNKKISTVLATFKESYISN